LNKKVAKGKSACNNKRRKRRAAKVGGVTLAQLYQRLAINDLQVSAQHIISDLIKSPSSSAAICRLLQVKNNIYTCTVLQKYEFDPSHSLLPAAPSAVCILPLQVKVN